MLCQGTLRGETARTPKEFSYYSPREYTYRERKAQGKGSLYEARRC